MKTGGFPCRFGGCDEVFVVMAQGSMPALTAASGLRTDHEVAAHDYHHRRLDEIKKPVWAPTFRPKAK